MISFIVCSVNDKLREELSANLGLTAGVPYEIIAFDNREAGLGLARVYNMCAEKARGDILCFLHEDILFHTHGWGRIITEFMKARQACGCVGFAGSAAKSRCVSGWGQRVCYNRMNLVKYKNGAFCGRELRGMGLGEFASVLTLDGLCMFVPRRVWNECRFDEENLTGFHLYDLDFTLRVAEKYENYVCSAVDVEHLSPGKFGKEWFAESLKFHRRWKERLPRYIDTPSSGQIAKDEEFMEYHLVKSLLKYGFDRGLALDYARQFGKDHPWALGKRLRLKFKSWRAR